MKKGDQRRRPCRPNPNGAREGQHPAYAARVCHSTDSTLFIPLILAPLVRFSCQQMPIHSRPIAVSSPETGTVQTGRT